MTPRTTATRPLAALGALALVAAGLLVTASPAYAATFTVNSLLDDASPGTLRQAILDANANGGPDTIEFDLPAGSTITLTSALPAITEPLTIAGPGSDALTIAAAATGFTFTAPAAVSTITGLTLYGAGAVGTGIDTAAELSITDVDISGFTVNGIRTTASLALSDSELAANNTHLNADFSTAGQTLTLTVVEIAGGNVGVNVSAAAETGALVFERLNAHDLSLWGIFLTATDGADVSVVNSQLTRNDVGGWFEIAGGADRNTLQIIETTASANEEEAYVVDVEDTDVLFRDSVTSENGHVDMGGGSAGGAARIYLVDSEFTSEGSIFSLNEGANGALYFADVDGESGVTLDDTDLLDNTSYSGGAAANLFASAGQDDVTTVRIVDSTISGNATIAGGAGGLALGTFNPDGEFTVEIERTTISGNSTSGAGGGLAFRAQTPDAGQPTLTIADSTISGNSADRGAGLSLDRWGPEGHSGTVLVRNSTISGNTGPTYAGIHLRGEAAGEFGMLLENSTVFGNSTGVGVLVEAALDIRNSIVANNGATDLDAEPGATATVEYSNVQRPAAALAAGITAGPGNQVGIDPQLGALADNGGPTLTHLPQPGSPVFDAGDPAFAPPPASDQRGQPRVLTRLDMGAVESPLTLPATGGDGGARRPDRGGRARAARGGRALVRPASHLALVGAGRQRLATRPRPKMNQRIEPRMLRKNATTIQMNLPKAPWFGFFTIDTTVTMKMTRAMMLPKVKLTGSMPRA